MGELEQANTMSGPTSTVMGGDLPLEKLEELQATVYMALEKGKHDQDAAKLYAHKSSPCNPDRSHAESKKTSRRERRGLGT